MSRQINQPINQVRLTNVAVVRYNYKGKRFEIACYRNKVIDYRNGLETDLSEVLQTDRIFTNVSKGQFANRSDLQKAFGKTKDDEEIARIILEKGNSLQISNLEREQMYADTLNQIANWISSNCVHSESGRPYTVSQIKHALGKSNYQVQPHKPIKKQYLDAVKFLKSSADSIPIERAKMELSLQYNNNADEQHQQDNNRVDTVLSDLGPRGLKIVREEDSSNNNNDDKSSSSNTTRTIIVHADPSLYRDMNELAKELNNGRLEILQQVVTIAQEQEGDIDLELEIERRRRQQHNNNNNNNNSNNNNNTALQKQKKTNDDDEVEEEVGQLIEKLEAVRMKATAGATPEDDNDQQEPLTTTSRKNQKKARKKKKKQANRNNNNRKDGDDDGSSSNNADVNTTKAADATDTTTEPTQQQQHSSNSVTTGAAATTNNNVVQQQMGGGDTTAAAGDATATTTTATTTATTKSCNTCGGVFYTAAEYRAHFRSDWHRFNQKLKLKGVSPVSYEEFQLCDAEAFFGGDGQE